MGSGLLPDDGGLQPPGLLLGNAFSAEATGVSHRKYRFIRVVILYHFLILLLFSMNRLTFPSNK